ncbi:MAG: PAS domain S-box protein [Syntrophales bacterium]|nr:PAS domain S-box protein [Syntrophales bacterium]MDD4339805.1 PAS domain S-box protein [Syntrophales bacterium]HOG08055.1 PAS domain S-box protein [Syntrophales bacterium]
MTGNPNDEDLRERIRALEEESAQRRRVEEALRESERRYRFLAERINDILWIMDLDLRTVYVTPSVQTVLGFTPEERLRQNVEEQLAPDSLSTALETLSREIAFEKQHGADPDRSVTLTLEFYHRDGSTRWLETIISGIRDDRGVLTRLYGVSRDVTRRRAAEEALKTANKQLEEANRSLGLAYAWMRDRKDQLKQQLFREEMGILLNNDGLIEGLSEKVMEHLGRSRDRLIGHPVRELIKEEYRVDFSREFRQAWMGPSQEVFVEFLDTKDRSKIFDVKLTRLTLSGSRLVLMTLR